jgi:hypothetical protein
MKYVPAVVLTVLLCVSVSVFAQRTDERVDSVALALIKEEGLKRSRVMDLLGALCDVYGPRLTWSPEYARGADWVSAQLESWGLQNIHYDRWAPTGKGWSLKNFSAMITAPVPFPVIAYPAAWSPGLKKSEAEVVFLDVKTPDDFARYTGKLKGKYVLLNEPFDVRAHFESQAERLADSVLLRMANAEAQTGRRGRRGGQLFAQMNSPNLDSAFAAARQLFPNQDSAAVMRRLLAMRVDPKKLEFVQKEGALAAVTVGRGDGGTMIVAAASVPRDPGAPQGQRLSSYHPDAPQIIPQVVFAAEHYNRLVRLVRQGQPVRLAMELQVTFTKPDSGFNIIAEIPGTDLKDEIVMLGGHFDTWHAGTGATDNNTGSAACMEALRILQTLARDHGLKPRRTVRIGLWGGEEQGLHGSREYVTQYLAARAGGTFAAGADGGGGGTRTPEFDKFSVYFNHDNGTGRIRGIYLQGNEGARAVFRRWLTAFADPTAQTVTAMNTGGTDHQSFDAVGLPAFQFIQDPVEYDTRTHHYNMDVLERVEAEDMKQAATLMAFFAYSAANRDAKIPRKPATAPAGR